MQVEASGLLGGGVWVVVLVGLCGRHHPWSMTACSSLCCVASFVAVPGWSGGQSVKSVAVLVVAALQHQMHATAQLCCVAPCVGKCVWFIQAGQKLRGGDVGGMAKGKGRARGRGKEGGVVRVLL